MLNVFASVGAIFGFLFTIPEVMWVCIFILAMNWVFSD
jgi:hypothetical protein